MRVSKSLSVCSYHVMVIGEVYPSFYTFHAFSYSLSMSLCNSCTLSYRCRLSVSPQSPLLQLLAPFMSPILPILQLSASFICLPQFQYFNFRRHLSVSPFPHYFNHWRCLSVFHSPSTSFIGAVYLSLRIPQYFSYRRRLSVSPLSPLI